MAVPSVVTAWVDEVARLTTPDAVVYCDGSDAERDRLVAECLATGELIALNQQKPARLLPPSQRAARRRAHRAPDLHLHRPSQTTPGPTTTGWRRPTRAAKLTPLFGGAMKGRTMYVVPFLMGPPGSRFAKVGVEITDSQYVVLNMRIMTRMGAVALDHLGDPIDFTRCLHSLGDLSPERRFIVHFPEENAVWSIGSGYGGNALLGKKCLALRLASWLAREEGWLAEHMLILGLESPDGRVHYVDRRVPVGVRQDQPGDAGAAGVDAGLEGVDGRRRHRVAAARRRRPALGGQPGGRLLRRRARHEPQDQPERVRDDPARHDLHERRAAARRHAVVGRARRSAAGRSARLAGPAVDAGVGREGRAPEQPLHDAGDATARRSRRSSTTRTACRSTRCSSARAGSGACRWSTRRATGTHGTFLGATLSSETTAAATGKVGVLRRDPMAMLPFCGYNMGDYFGHWLDVGAGADEAAADLPRQLVPHRRRRQVPLARLRRQPARAEVDPRALRRPRRGDRDADRLPADDRRASIERGLRSGRRRPGARCCSVDPAEWVEAVAGQEDYFRQYGSHLPEALHAGARRPRPAHPRRDGVRPAPSVGHQGIIPGWPASRDGAIASLAILRWQRGAGGRRAPRRPGR